MPAPGNPFPTQAVATGHETLTLDTAAIREARRLLDEYLSAPATFSRGTVIAVVGEYGTGKTHLVAEMGRHIAGSPRRSLTYTISLEASEEGFVALYKSFVRGLDQRDVTRRVREYYADLVADELESSELTQALARPLRAGQLDPLELVDRVNLIESDLLARLRSRLTDVTQKEEFSIALTLLLREGFYDAAWEWFRGGAPDQILVDRGIRDPIATDELVLEAMGVFALLYGRRGHSFVLLIDELHKLLSTARNPAAATIAAVKKLLQVFAAADGLLVLVGLEDYIDVVGKDSVERLGQVIRMAPLTTEDAETYITRAKVAAGGEATLWPFSPDTVRYLLKITDGVARQFIRLCHHLYRRAVDVRTAVTEPMIREVARDRIVLDTVDSVRNEVRAVLDAQGLLYYRQHRLGANVRVDYWIPFGDEESGCAVIVTGSIFDADEVAPLREAAIEIRKAAPGADTVLVVVGFLPSVLQDEITDFFGIEPLMYDQWTFQGGLSSILAGRISVFESASSEDPVVLLRNRLERMNRQYTNTRLYLQQLTASVDTMRTSSEYHFSAFHRSLDDLAQAVQPTRSEAGEAPSPGLPADVTGLFDQADEALSVAGKVDNAIREALSGGIRARDALRTSLSTRVFEAMGVAAVIRSLLAEFQREVTDWYRRYVRKERDADRTTLSALCHNYDSLYDQVPVFRLNDLEDFELYATRASGTPRQRGYLALSGFGGRVQDALLSADAGTSD
ncbi:AAA family ATPase [Amycolatopsis pigmentata]|uniref:AAA family ATPase n=1 Tax=Amycolatopsis pigmentata TaxID=450801 RepID=A0ABW5G0R4_9PSEU